MIWRCICNTGHTIKCVHRIGARFLLAEDVKEKNRLKMNNMRNMLSMIPTTSLLRLESMFPLKNSMKCMK